MKAWSAANRSYDAVIIGGAIGGLVAAAYLAGGGARVLLVEQRDRFGGRAETVEFAQGFRAPLLSHTVFALDPRMVRELHLVWHGLRFAKRDMKLVALRPGGQHIVLPRKTCRVRGAFTPADARAYRAFRKDATAFARRMRPLWNGSAGGLVGENKDRALAAIVRRLQLSDRDAERLDELSRVSAAGYLDRWLETDALKAAFSFDVATSGLSPQEAGSALVLIWRYAQVSCGRQAAVSQLRGGPGALAAALEAAARRRGAELRLNAQVTSIVVEGGRAVGVTLASGEIVAAGSVLSCLDRRRTLLGLVPPGAIGFGAAANLPDYRKVAIAQLMLGLNGPPPFAGLERRELGARMAIAERPEIAAEAKGAALAGRIPAELVIEATIPTASDPHLAPVGQHVLSAVLPYMPAAIEGGWAAHRDRLRKQVLGTLERFAPGLKDRVVAHRMFTPDDIAARYGGSAAELTAPWSRLLASYNSRIRTPIAGLYLCGRSAEPVNALSGRAGRLAAGLVFSERPQRKAGVS